MGIKQSFLSQKIIKKERFTIDRGIEIEDTVFYFPPNSHLSFYISSSDYQSIFEGCFKLKGDPIDLQMLYQIVIGLRTGQGFRMIETL